jgi:sortase, SrtB family
MAIFLMMAGASAILVPLIEQTIEITQGEAEYAELTMQYSAANEEAITLVQDTMPVLYAEEETAEPIIATNEQTPPSNVPSKNTTPTRTGNTGIDFSALQAVNKDCVAWLKIPGTKIDYPVVQTDDVDYYLHHTFTGKKNKVGTLFSLGKTDYEAPSKNIAVYGHNISGSGQNMFQPLLSYKKESFYLKHNTIRFDTIYQSGTYTVFAVINMDKSEWDSSAAIFASDEAFLEYVNRAKSQALYETGVEVKASDYILTLITCDRSYIPIDGRLVVMAVKQ